MFKEFGEFLAFIFKGLGKLLLWLLVRLGLWVPLAFSVLFFLVLAITGTEYASVSGLFVFGLIVTTVLSLVATIAFAVKRKMKKLPENRNTQKQVVSKDKAKFVDKTEEMPVVDNSDGEVNAQVQSYAPPVQPYPIVQGVPPQSVTPTQSAFTVGGYPYAGQYNFQPYNVPPQPYNAQPYNAPPYVPPQPYSQAQYQQTGTNVPNGFTSQSANNDGGFSRDGMSARDNFSRDNGGFSRDNGGFGRDNFSRDSFGRNRDLPSRDSFSRDGFNREDSSRSQLRITPDEQPKIYRTRKDESVLIYEYSDRVEFYRKTASGLTFLYSEKKR
ncbi:MAG: hypothetical protein J6B79_07085 [Clostridia bacterium]|nr:hypothetical protein [Clostridia bacterium]